MRREIERPFGRFFVFRLPMEIYESWESIFRRIGERPPHRGRGRCPIHDGDSPFSLSVNEDKGLFHCFVCGAGGDKLDFIQQLYRCDFKEALRFFGLEAGPPPAPDPAEVRRLKVQGALRTWAQTLRWELNFEHFVREKVISRALSRLRRDPPEDAWAWEWLAWALTGLDAIAHKLDMLSGTEIEIIEAYKILKDAA
jgi:hypothetical protein